MVDIYGMMVVEEKNLTLAENRTMETEATIHEYSILANSVEMVMVVEDDEERFYSVRYLVDKKFGFRTFLKMSEAEQFYSQMKAQIILLEIKDLARFAK